MTLKALFQSNAKIPENFKGLSVELELLRKNKEWTYQFATVTGNKTGRTSQLISKPSLSTQPMKGSTTPLGSTPSTLYEQRSGFFYVPQESEQRKS